MVDTAATPPTRAKPRRMTARSFFMVVAPIGGRFLRGSCCRCKPVPDARSLSRPLRRRLRAPRQERRERKACASDGSSSEMVSAGRAVAHRQRRTRVERGDDGDPAREGQGEKSEGEELAHRMAPDREGFQQLPLVQVASAVLASSAATTAIPPARAKPRIARTKILRMRPPISNRLKTKATLLDRRDNPRLGVTQKYSDCRLQ